MTKEELDQALYQVRGFIPKIVSGPGSLIRSFDGWNNPHPEHYRGVPVEFHAGLGEQVLIMPIDQDAFN